MNYWKLFLLAGMVSMPQYCFGQVASVPKPLTTLEPVEFSTQEADSSSLIQASSQQIPGASSVSQSTSPAILHNVMPSSTSTPDRRALPAPFDSPPFPSGEWPIGG